MRVATILYLMAVEALVSAISCIFIHIMLIHYSNALIKRAQIWLAITQIQAHISGYNFPSCEIIDHYSHYFIIFHYYSYIHHEQGYEYFPITINSLTNLSQFAFLICCCRFCKIVLFLILCMSILYPIFLDNFTLVNETIQQLNMFKKKQKKNQKPKQPVQLTHVQTQADAFPHKQGKTRAQFAERFDNNSENATSSRYKLKCKQLQKTLITIKNLLEQQLDNILTGAPITQIYNTMIQSQLFRVQTKTKGEVAADLDKIIQATQLLYSKLHNNQKVKDLLYVKDQLELLLFFKHLFGKPYTVCNLPNFRKVLNTIWQHQIFNSFDAKKMAEHLRLWAIGIQFPLNPAAIPIHRLVFNNPQKIKKYSLLISNQVTYCHIDAGDCIGLTPLLAAVHANKTDAYEQIIKSGANIFRCPLTLIKNTQNITVTKKGNKQQVQIIQPLTQRRQYNVFELLLNYKQYQQIVNILSLNQVYKLKKLKKSNVEVYKKLADIPDCCLQVHWKTFKGFLSFKQLPKDIITIYKKGGSLRIDYHLDDILSNSQEGHFSILIRAGVQEGSKLQYYYINHNKKKIYNLMKEIHSQKLRLRYEQITQLGNIQQQYISQLKSTSKLQQTKQVMQISAQFCHENVSKAPIYQFKKLPTYEKLLFDTQILDYGLIQQSETNCTMKQNIGNLPKVKSKSIKSTSKFTIQWIKQKINLGHISYILSLLDKKSPLFLKINRIFDMLLKQQCFNSKYTNKLPMKMTFDLGSQFTLQVEMKNITYMALDDAVFGLQFRAKQMSYQQQNMGVSSLQQTVIMAQNYTINMSRFLGNTQKLLQIQEQQANRKFQEMLSREIAGNVSDQQDNNMNEKKQKEVLNSQRNFQYKFFDNS